MQTSNLVQQFLFWGVWLIIPVLWDVLVELLGSIMVVVKYIRYKKETIDYNVTVTILVPVYNSQSTLRMCLDSILNQSYPLDRLETFLIDNGGRDESYSIFKSFQDEHPQMKLWWFFSQQGKAKALNKGIFGSTGRYVVNIDSDGFLDRNAILNIVKRFETDHSITCMTGVVLIDPVQVEATKSAFLKAVRLCEFYEYTETFLVGRNHQSVLNSMYTLAGAFSCFQREALARTQLYNMETVGEDTHMTFQVRNFVGGRIVLCENAFFYVDPIEGLDKLYTQRQRWQRGELEVARLFSEMHMGGFQDFFKKFTMRIVISDHTLAFPRLIWFFAMIYLYFINYPLKLLVGANLLMYAIYSANSLIYMQVAALYLKNQEGTRKYVYRHWYVCLIIPIYKFLVYWARVAGIINSVSGESKWQVQTLSEEVKAVKRNIAETLKTKFPIIEIIRRAVNHE